MRRFVIFSREGRTKGDWKDPMKAGRMDIIFHSIISAMFLSHGVRPNVIVDIILNGPPNPPRHIEIRYDENSTISKKDIGTLIKSTLWKYKKGKKVKAFPGVFIDDKSLEELLEELKEEGHIYLLDERGKDISEVEIKENPIFVLGDHEGLPRKEKKFVKKIAEETVSVGPLPYFTSQTITIVNNFLDRAEII